MKNKKIMMTQKLYKILSSVLEITVDEIKSHKTNESLEAIGLDSLKFIKMIVMIENLFNIEIFDSDLIKTNFNTIDSIIHMLDKYLIVHNPVKKVIISDCDNVLWNGIAGEEKLVLDEICIAYQLKLVELSKKGVLICLCSKNDSNNISEAFVQLDMVLTKEYIVAEQINWQDKVTNIQLLAKTLNLSVDSFIFVDDSAYELGLVSSAYPEITCIKAEKIDDSWIKHLDILFSPSSTINRTEQYIQQKEREKVHVRCKDVEEYNSTLATVITCEDAHENQVARISELSNRTNQFNLSSARYSEQEIFDFLTNNEYAVISVSLSDIYGDMGLVGCAVLQLPQYKIEAFMISCRVFDRGVEQILLNRIKEILPNKNITGVFRDNGKNERFSAFYEQNGIRTEIIDA